MREQELIVMKFGGSAVENADRFNNAAKIIASFAQQYRVAVVVSAIYGVTNRLLEVAGNIKSGEKQKVEEEAESLYQLHNSVAYSLGLSEQRPLVQSLNGFRADLLSFAKRYALHPFEEDFISSYGERISYLLLSGAINGQRVKSQGVDSARVIVTNNEYGNAKADLKSSQALAKESIIPLMEMGIVPVLGGFYGLSWEGRIAILGRGGSDYSAAVIANILNADRLILWKEVDGIYTSDPKIDPLADFLADVSYDQAEHMARKGAKIIHPQSIAPLRVKNIPIEVRNFNHPHKSGSWINGKLHYERLAIKCQ